MDTFGFLGYPLPAMAQIERIYLGESHTDQTSVGENTADQDSTESVYSSELAGLKINAETFKKKQKSIAVRATSSSLSDYPAITETRIREEADALFLRLSQARVITDGDCS